jgi:hypothetical protein
MANKVRAVPNLPRQARAGTRVQVDGLNGVLKKLERLAMWSEKDFRKLVEINERVGEVYNNSLRANIKDFHRDIKVQFKDRDDIIVKRGQMRRSVGVWRPDENKINTLAGPRTNNIGRRKRGVRKNSDGWFAHIVEGGDSFGRKKRTRNTGVFERSKRATVGRANALLVRLLRQEFKRFMK